MIDHLLGGAALPALALSLLASPISTDLTQIIDGESSARTSSEGARVEMPCDDYRRSEPQMEFVKDPPGFGHGAHMGTLYWAFMWNGCRINGFEAAGSGLKNHRNGCAFNGPIPDSGLGRHTFHYKYNAGQDPQTTGWLWALDPIDCSHIGPASTREGIFVHSEGTYQWPIHHWDNYLTHGCIKVRPKMLELMRYWQGIDGRSTGSIKVRQA